MRARTWIIVVSLGLNLALVVFLLASRSSSRTDSPPSWNSQPEMAAGRVLIRTNTVVRKQNFTWQEVESEDYGVYIRNLRAIGCPEQTIRDIIVADVNQLFDYRRKQEPMPGNFQWWRSEPDPAVAKERTAKEQALEEERRSLLTRLLGPGWDKPADASAASAGIHLEGPLLGELSSEAKQLVYDIVSQFNRKRDVHRDSQLEVGLNPDPAVMARLRLEMKNDLARVLRPDQLEEFLLRYSPTADQMRKEFRGLNLTPDEFRAVFQVREPGELELAQLEQSRQTYDGSVSRRSVEIQNNLEDALKQTLGMERYENLKLNQDPLFRETKSLAEKVGVSDEALFTMYQINQETEAERRRIREDDDLTVEEKIEELAEVQAAQQKSLERLLGGDNFKRLLQLQEKHP